MREDNVLNISKFNLAICEDCENKININKQIKHKEKFEMDKTIYLTYYDCPKCSRRHFVQIDDDYTLKLLKNTTMLFIKLSCKKKKGISIDKEEIKRFEDLRKKISKKRTNLMMKYQDKEIVDENKTFIIKFSI